MDDDNISLNPITPAGSEESDASEDAKQLKSLNTYLNSLPYDCESTEEMNEKLRYIVDKIYACARTLNWPAMVGWDAKLQYWLHLRYPMSRPTRAALAKFYYELIVTPGTESRLLHGWVDMLGRLIPNKPGSRRKLETSDLELSWRSLWRVMEPEVWLSAGDVDTTRPVPSLLLSAADVASRYFPASEVENIIETILPKFEMATTTTVLTLLTSFLPPTNVHLYFPILFKIWEAFNSNQLDERMLDTFSALSQEQLASPPSSGDEGVSASLWKDVGLFTDDQWAKIARTCIVAMNVSVGPSGTSNSTAAHADLGQSGRVTKKGPGVIQSLSSIFVYSMFLDGPIKASDEDSSGYLAGSKALQSLETIIISIETYFHPSNSGAWTANLTTFLQRLAYDFSKRWFEEHQPECRTPIARRLTPAIKREFVKTLKTPALLAMFSKDPVSTAFAQGSIKTMSGLEPSIIMPAVLERAYNGLESVNETHRTTAVLNLLSGVAPTLATEKIWLGGQKHLLPLLEQALPGLDINDPLKVCATVFIVAAVSNIKIGDASQSVPLSLGNDAPGEDVTMDDATTMLPDGSEQLEPTLNRDEERTLVRESTASFPDWVVSLFRRAFAIFENLPEEGGSSNKTGGKSEDAILKTLQTALDPIAAHLSDSLFDLVLGVTFDYATTNARANSVRAFGSLVSSLAKANPKKTIAKFLPYCLEQIRNELEHGASSTRTTSTNLPAPSDTTLHWHLYIVRNVLGYGGSELVEHKDRILDLMRTLIRWAKGERAYSTGGRLVGRVLAALTAVYPLEQRLVNPDEWNSDDFNRTHYTQWGKLYRAEDVKIAWHVPSAKEIDFALEILDTIVSPCLDLLERILEIPPLAREAVWRNDFCRHLHVVRTSWSGLPTIFLAPEVPVSDKEIDLSTEIPALTASPLNMRSGFVLTDPKDPRYQKVLAHRERFGKFLHQAAVSLNQAEHANNGDDHIDAVISVSRGIDTYLLEYGMTRTSYLSQKKVYDVARDAALLGAKQKEMPRSVWIKRAQFYHAARLHSHNQYRRRGPLDTQLVDDLFEFSLSKYTRVRKNAQSVLTNVVSYLVRAARQVLLRAYDALSTELKRGKSADPDRQKGALYLLWNKSLASYAVNTPLYLEPYFQALLAFQNQEKPSIQQLVAASIEDAFPYITREAMDSTLASAGPTRSLDESLDLLDRVLGPFDNTLLAIARSKTQPRLKVKTESYNATRKAVLAVARDPSIHWKYKQWAIGLLSCLLPKDTPTTPEIALIFVENVISDHPVMRQYAQSALLKLLRSIKARTFSKTAENLWLNIRHNPLQVTVQIPDFKSFMEIAEQPLTTGANDLVLIDKYLEGALIWNPSIKGYRLPPNDLSPFEWESSSRDVMSKIRDALDQAWFTRLSILWSQEGNRSNTNTDLRSDNARFIKYLVKMFEGVHIDLILPIIDSLWRNPDKFQQRAGAELLSGLVRGSKHFPLRLSAKLWSWFTPRLPDIFAQMTPDTITFWDSCLMQILEERDPRRVQPLVDYIDSVPLDFTGDSVFALSKALTCKGSLSDALSFRFLPKLPSYWNAYLDNLNTPYAEIRQHLVGNLGAMIGLQWRPGYSSAAKLLDDCTPNKDPLLVLDASQTDWIHQLVEKFPQWKMERLPGAQVSHSTYDKVGLSVLTWVWLAAYIPRSPALFVYAQPLLPEILRMSELQDSSEVQAYSSGVLYVLSAVPPPKEFIEPFTESFIDAVRSSPSWRIRHKAIPVLFVWYFRNLPSLSQALVSRIVNVLVECLKDENVEVREIAASTLSSVFRCSEKQHVVTFKDRFSRMAQRTKLAGRNDPKYAETLRTLHSAILGMIAALQAFPYVIEPWMPSLIERLSRYSSEPQPVSTAIRKFAANFKKTHQDTWHVDQHLFDEDQAQALATMVTGTSYYA